MTSKEDKNAALYALIGYIIYFLVIVFAMYLVYVRNKQSGAREIIAGILSALCCTPCYIGYAFATPVKYAKYVKFNNLSKIK